MPWRARGARVGLPGRPEPAVVARFGSLGLPARPITAVVVRSQEALTYACSPDGRTGWRCGRCGQGSIADPKVGARCPTCHSEVIATQHELGLWLVGLVTAVLLLGWILLEWWG